MEVLVVLTVLLVSSFAVSSGARGPAPSTLARHGLAPAATELQNASASLAAGGGPAGGANWICQGTSGSGSIGCGPTSPSAPLSSASPHPIANTLPDWSHQALAPAPRSSSALTYDFADKYVVLFGGAQGSAVFGDTWTYNGAWTHLAPPTSPSARSGAAFAYDFKDGYAVLFGGLSGSTRLSDTWKFVHGTWTHLTPVTSPPALGNVSMVWDGNDSYALLFGGSTSLATSAQTWSFVAGAWTQHSTSPTPAARESASLAYDPVSGWVLLFGGRSGSTVFNDTWNYTRGHWTQVHPSTSPPGVYGASIANDSTDGYLVLFGGRNSLGHDQGATWTFVHLAWTQMTPSISPPARGFTGSAFDKVLSKVVLFGGNRSSPLADTWLYRADVWSHPTYGPMPRYAAMMTYDEADGYVLLFAGATTHLTTPTFFGDTWTYAHGHWTQLKPSVAPSPRIGAVMTYDQADGYVLLFGGESSMSSTSKLNDTWNFSAGKWTQLHPATAPSPRILPGFAYDAADGYVLLFGGEGFNPTLTYQGTFNDTWFFQGGIWTEWTTPGCTNCGPVPQGTAGPGMAYDSWDGYIVLFGGQNFTSTTVFSAIALSTTWTYLAGNWTNITATAGTPPSGRYGPVMVYDALDGYVLLFGGTNGTVASADTWSFVSGSWTLLNPAVNPGQDYFASAAYDPVDRTVVYLSGASFSGQTWLY